MTREEIQSISLTDGWLFTPRQDKKDRTKIVVEQTEIVRCRNCRYYDGCDWCNRHDIVTNDDWFCADGERGEE